MSEYNQTPEDRPAESPVLDVPKEETSEQTPEAQARALLEELGQLNISLEEVPGKLEAANQVGSMSAALGQTRKENQELRQAMAELRGMMQGQQAALTHQPQVDEYGQPVVDVSQFVNKNELTSTLRNFYNEEVLRPQQMAQQRVSQELSNVQQDQDFPVLQPVWDKHMENSQTQAALFAGQTTIEKEYNRVWKAYYRESLKKTTDVLQKVAKKGQPQAPHIEQGDTRSTPMPTVDKEKSQRFTDINKQRQTGALDSDSALTELVKTVLPVDDPFFRL